MGKDSAPRAFDGFAPLLRPLVDRGVMAGAVALVANVERVLHAEAVGYADVGERRAMLVDDLFWVASMTKPITAAAVMMLVDEGLVRLDDALADYIAGFLEVLVQTADGSLRPPKRPPTLRDALSHTSGLRFWNSFDGGRIDLSPLEATIGRNLREPLLGDPGERYAYSNEGIDAAGRVVEIVSGMPFEQFLEERFFAPLGMRDTTFFPSAEQLERLAKSYKPDAAGDSLEEVAIGQLSYPLEGAGRHLSPAGGLFSTAPDMARFGQMLVAEGRLKDRMYLRPESVREMKKKQTGALPEWYGLGLGLAPDGSSHGHEGAYKTSLQIEQGVVRVFLTQQAGEWGGRGGENPAELFHETVRRAFLGRGPAVGPAKLEGGRNPGDPRSAGS